MRFIKNKKKKTIGNSVKYTITAHAHDANYPITQSIHKHDSYTILLVPKVGLVVTNHVREFYIFDDDDYYYYYYYYHYYYHYYYYYYYQS